jgi:hypothetical protein
MIEQNRNGWDNGDTWRWRMSAPSTVQTIVVSDLAEEAEAQREERVKRGARVVPFGFGRAMTQPFVERDPLTWEGED